MKILTINCGSSSIKYKLFEFPEEKTISKGIIEHIGEKGAKVASHADGMQLLFKKLLSKKVIAGLDEIAAIGHRVVHGAEEFCEPHLLDKRVIKKITQCAKLAPLHNPANLAGIKAALKVLPFVPHAAVFDTAFHQTIPRYAYMYAVPLFCYHKYGIRRYGFHGTSHQYVSIKAAQMLGKPLRRLTLITCHLGNGCSITAVRKGKSVDTSMGFTPLEGLIMGTRCGDIDAAAVLYLMNRERISTHQVDSLLNKKSGLLGVSGVSNDIRDIKEAVSRGHRYAALALDMFIYRIKKYIGAYLMVLGGADAVCFTAGIGENCSDIVGDLKKSIKKISPRTKVLVVPTNEELMIGALTYKLVQKKRRR